MNGRENRFGNAGAKPPRAYDVWLAAATLFLLSLGLIMVTSSSITLADRNYGGPLYYFWRQAAALLAGLGLGAVIFNIPMAKWEKFSGWLLLAGIVLLLLTIAPGVGREVNGSMRWIRLGPVNLQSSEFVKIFVVAYVAAYMVRRAESLRSTFSGFVMPCGVVTLVAALLLLEPDYGSAVIIFLTMLGMLFMGGAPLLRFFGCMLAATAALGALAVLAPYRSARLKAFIDPWADPFGSGYQLTQSLMAFGRGEWFGVGLGSSVQKLFYLTQAHTDFIFAIVAEELGLVFTLALILIFFLLVCRAFAAARGAQRGGRSFSAFMAYGAGLSIGAQAFIHMGVNVGVLPTKGLTLPLFSYGSNSLVASCILIAILLRVDRENRAALAEQSLNEAPGYGK